ncbi:hypothetical protein B842_02255 [Corynebacterium humireducens NBRC 106098 = DSM 45392]|uniref:Uncharacterized protein n=1 Tax=Corynebacterium humireducens NBRC 106098 = DSM 45392 TaxID=1223515 RepID=A0A0B5D9A9_9CORY|nr:hypothetical protein [Corynebacterium humireducens]AJE32304.1 hypothetical protein B842_02255 [Corynebacterium humireducens NBRC 106098 = DSM 45392]
MDDLAGLSRAERVDLLRSRMAALGGGVPQPTVGGPDVIAVPSDLARVLPGGGLVRRVVTQVSDCPALIVELIAQVTATGGHVGVVGWPELSLAGVVENGRLESIIVVPDPGADPLGIVGVLVEGLDLVVARWAVPLELSPVRARPLLGRLRGGQAALVLVGAGVPSPHVRVDATVTTFRGIGRGAGRIRGVDIAVRVEAKGRPPASTTVTVGQRAELRVV